LKAVLKEYFESSYNRIVEELENNQTNKMSQIETQIKNLRSDLEVKKLGNN